ncbi:BrxA family protein [Sphingobacterium multivorum]|uniref:BrxA family protein n=1 Tax=Sphingobacterium multivorum TaxID=28454 RepID=UPI0028B267A5|nr:BrxA family protein [Sphingobacterium multivorum]
MNYNLAFTAGALLYNESLLYVRAIEDIASYYSGEAVVNSEVLITNAESSRKRIKSELDKRFKQVDPTYLSKFLELSESDQRVILFLTICKTYSIITEFSLEVVYKKWLNYDNELGTYDFRYFLSSKLTEEELNNISTQSQYKLAQVAVKMYKDVGLYREKQLIPLQPSNDLINLIKNNRDEWFFHCILFTKAEEI